MFTLTGKCANSGNTIRQFVKRYFDAAVFLAAIATLAFPLAIMLPFFTFVPSFGDEMVDAAYNYANPGSLEASTYSVLGGITKLFTEGDIVVAMVLLAFSVFFPIVKLTIFWGVLVRPDASKLALVSGLELLGPWSMADVFVVSVLLLAFKSFPGGTTFSIQIGYYVFLLSVVSSLVATIVTKRRLTLEQKSASETQKGER